MHHLTNRYFFNMDLLLYTLAVSVGSSIVAVGILLIRPRVTPRLNSSDPSGLGMVYENLLKPLAVLELSMTFMAVLLTGPWLSWPALFLIPIAKVTQYYLLIVISTFFYNVFST